MTDNYITYPLLPRIGRWGIGLLGTYVKTRRMGFRNLGFFTGVKVMGWDSSPNWKSKSDVMTAVKRDMLFYNVGLSDGSVLDQEIINSKQGRDGLWLLLQRTFRGELGTRKETRIVFALIEKQGKDWMYKAISEREGPYYYDCPKDWLDRVEDIEDEYFGNWKAKVLMQA
jgi:hypothetical protein